MQANAITARYACLCLGMAMRKHGHHVRGIREANSLRLKAPSVRDY
jgi:hypothetical protein